MGYNHAKTLRQWQQWKEQEEKILRELNVDEELIKQLREYDWNIFKRERLIVSRQIPTSSNFFLNAPCYDKKEINTIDDVLDEIQNEALFTHLSKTDKTTLNIILLKMLGYSTSEISALLNISCQAIYSRIYHLKKSLKK